MIHFYILDLLVGYDGPLQFTMSPGNPDGVTDLRSLPNNESGKHAPFMNHT